MPKETEGFGVQALTEKINELVRQGNVRHIVVCNASGRKFLDIPVNAGVLAVLVAPMLSVAGAALALAGGWTIKVEHTEPEVVDEPAEPAEPSEEDS